MTHPSADDPPPGANKPLTDRASAPAGGASSSAANSSSDAAPSSSTFATRHPWAVFILPYAVIVGVNMLEPTPDSSFNLLGWTITYADYPLIYTVKILAAMATMIWLWPGYRQFPFRVSPLAFVVGAVGVVIWVGLCKLNLERATAQLMQLDGFVNFGERSAYNPLEQLAAQPLLAYGFLAVRFWGLAFVLPVIEEFFLRGFVMRYFFRDDWWKVPFGAMSPAAIVAGTLVPVLTHPTSELLAVLVWFSLVTWLMWRTRNIWDCVAAHMTTNLLLGLWVVASGDWYLM